MTEDSFLDGKLLVAMPGMGDPRFERSVVFMCAHKAEGAMGLIINKRADELDFVELLDQLDIDAVSNRDTAVYFGGPVESGRGFVLHSADYTSDDNTMHVTDGIGMTATLEILQDIAGGTGPSKSLLALGYAGWGPGQLESEFQANGWLSCEATDDIIFGADADGKWEAALASIGVSPAVLSATGGTA